MTAGLSPRTILAIDPRTQQRGLLIEVHPEIEGEPSDAQLRSFEGRMFDAQIRVGIFVTPLRTLVVQDTLSSMVLSSNRFAREAVLTESLLQGMHADPGIGDLYDRLMFWLTTAPENWMLLPNDLVVVMVPDVIGHLAQAELETFEGVLEPRRASA